MTPQFHVYPFSEDNPSIGHKIIELIVSSEMMTTGADGVNIWSGSAPEQLEALVEEYYSRKC